MMGDEATLWLAILGLVAVTAPAFVLVGWAARGWWLGQHSALLNDAIRDGTLVQYRAMRDGRSSDRLPADRYAEEGGTLAALPARDKEAA